MKVGNMMSYVIIVGGQLHNKGAQAMTFTVVDKIKDKYPDKEVVLFSSLYTERDRLEKNELNFQIFPWSIVLKMKILGLVESLHVGIKEYIKYFIIGTGLSKNKFNKIKYILKNADLMIDVSGYALSSQRGFKASLSYLYNIKIAKKYRIPTVLFPQSFGPFNYKKKESKIIIPLIKEYLEYPEIIYAREEDGVKHLNPFNLNNVIHSYDSVLLGKKEFTLSHLFRPHAIDSQRLDFEIYDNSVAIVPNEKIMEHGNEKLQYELYKILINELLRNNKNIYLLRHSFEDLEICKNIKSEFMNNNRVILIKEDLNCIQIDLLLRQFEFLIASRYHAIIHAYKNRVPTLVFGWAIKYQELLKYFLQEKYLFDVRNNQNKDSILRSLDLMLDNYKEESDVITKRMNQLETVQLLDEISIN